MSAPSDAHSDNVHQFDGKLRAYSNIITKYSIEVKDNVLKKYFSTLTNEQAKTSLSTIIGDNIGGGGSNFQAENGLDASDILTDIVIREDYTDLKGYLEEQLADMASGLCDSGRCVRLTQIWLAYMESKVIKMEQEMKI